VQRFSNCDGWLVSNGTGVIWESGHFAWRGDLFVLARSKDMVVICTWNE